MVKSTTTVPIIVEYPWLPEVDYSQAPVHPLWMQSVHWDQDDILGENVNRLGPPLQP